MSLQINDIGMRFGGRNGSWALRNVSLDVADNEFVSVVGASGSGKSTLLNIVSGLLDPSEGQVTIDGRTIDGPGIDRGVVFQSYSLLPWLTAAENIEFALKETGAPKRERTDRVSEMLDAVGLGDFGDRYPSQLSGGMRQRVAIARVLSYRPKMLLMDEPFGALDALTRRVMQELLMQIWEEYRLTVMLVTHDIGEAVALSDRVVVLGANPGHVRELVDIDLPRPRTRETVRLPAFQEREEYILDQIHAESLAAEHVALR